MKKELALATLLAIITTVSIIDLEKPQCDPEDQNEVNMDLFVTGCQCSPPKSNIGNKKHA